jgi:hypothetical protein
VSRSEAPGSPGAARPPAARRWAKIALGLLVTCALLVYLFHDVDPGGLGARLAGTHWGFLAGGVVLNLLALWVRARRWRYLFPPGPAPAGLDAAVLIGYMANNLLPLRAGELVRVYVVRRRGQRFWTVVATILVERVLDALAVVLILGALLLVLPVPRELEVAAVIFLAADLGAMVALAAVAAAPQRARAIAQRWSGRRAALGARLLRGLDTFAEGLRGIRAPQHLFPLLGWSAAIWLVLAGAVWVTFQAAHLALPFTAAWTVLAFAGIGVSLPSTPGFLGVFQAAVVLALALFGVSKTEALAYSLLLHASQYVPVTLAGLVLLVREHVSLSEATRPPDTRSEASPGAGAG